MLRKILVVVSIPLMLQFAFTFWLAGRVQRKEAFSSKQQQKADFLLAIEVTTGLAAHATANNVLYSLSGSRKYFEQYAADCSELKLDLARFEEVIACPE